MPAKADRNHVEMDTGDVLALQNSHRLALAMNRKSVIKTTQEDQLRVVHVVVSKYEV